MLSSIEYEISAAHRTKMLKREHSRSVVECLTRDQGFAQLEKYLNLEGFLEKSLKIKFALKSTGKSLKALTSA